MLQITETGQSSYQTLLCSESDIYYDTAVFTRFLKCGSLEHVSTKFKGVRHGIKACFYSRKFYVDSAHAQHKNKEHLFPGLMSESPKYRESYQDYAFQFVKKIKGTTEKCDPS